ncbi:MAG: hypothetical protein ACFFGZ_10695 [Candidatus Thorarchaeota archaeon]
MVKETQDFIDFEPKLIKMLPPKTIDAGYEYWKLLQNLADSPKTVKELWDLYKDAETGEYSITIKTIYRYLEKLEKLGFVAVAGHRITKGNRIPEKLYGRTAKIFFIQPAADGRWETWGREEANCYSEKLANILKESFGVTIADNAAFHEVFQRFFALRAQAIGSTLKEAKENKILTEIFATAELEQIRGLSLYSSIFITLLQHPEIIEQLQELLDLIK